jgi:hypothetical protein
VGYFGRDQLDSAEGRIAAGASGQLRIVLCRRLFAVIVSVVSPADPPGCRVVRAMVACRSSWIVVVS